MGLPASIQRDVEDIAQIDVVQTILEMACELTGMGFAAVARVTEDRWVACSVVDKVNFGLKAGGELVVGTTLCDEIRRSRQAITIDNVKEDALYCAHHTPAMYGLQSYISVPLVLRGGEFFGTLCAIDANPHAVSSPQVLNTFKLWAELIAFHLKAGRDLSESRNALVAERHSGELRDRFLAVLGHDLRSPLAAISSGTSLLGDEALSTRGRTMVRMIAESATRSLGIVDNVLEWARTGLGGGLNLRLDPNTSLVSVVENVVSELRTVHADRDVRVSLPDFPNLRIDPGRIGQMLSNLIGNAMVHGAEDSPVEVIGRLDGLDLELDVVNHGPTIPAAILEQIFKPFFRGELKARARFHGLGLGLYISSEIAHAHGGSLTATSEAGVTSFCFRLPNATR